MFHFHIECEEPTLLCSLDQNPLDSFCYEYSWLSSSLTSCLVPLSERAAVWEVVASLPASLIYPGTWGFCQRDAVQIMSAPHRLLLLCNPGGFSVHQGSFRCVRWRLQGFAVRGGESLREEGRGGGWGRERKESCVASLGFYCVHWCVTWQNMLKSHCFGAVCVCRLGANIDLHVLYDLRLLHRIFFFMSFPLPRISFHPCSKDKISLPA